MKVAAIYDNWFLKAVLKVGTVICFQHYWNTQECAFSIQISFLVFFLFFKFLLFELGRAWRTYDHRQSLYGSAAAGWRSDQWTADVQTLNVCSWTRFKDTAFSGLLLPDTCTSPRRCQTPKRSKSGESRSRFFFLGSIPIYERLRDFQLWSVFELLVLLDAVPVVAQARVGVTG